MTMTEGVDESDNFEEPTMQVAPSNADSFRKLRRELFAPNTNPRQEDVVAAF